MKPLRYHATALDACGKLPFWLDQMLLDYVSPEMERAALSTASVALVVIHGYDDYVFDAENFAALEKSKLPVVVLDYYEPASVSLAQHAQLFEALKALKVVGWFKRDFKVDEVFTGCPVWPLDFTVPRYTDYDALESRDTYDKRPIDILMLWGYSSLDRPKLAGRLMAALDQFKTGPCPAQTIEDVDWLLDNHQPFAMALLYAPPYRRVSPDRMFKLQNMAKITISLFGNGLKCFRSSEAGYNSVCAHQAPESIRWSYPWIDQHNCLGLANLPGARALDLDSAVEKLRYWSVLDYGSLYTLYCNGVENNQNYVRDVYGHDYVVPKILSVL